MVFVPGFGRLYRLSKYVGWLVPLLVLAVSMLPATCGAALPRRLVLLLDGVAYRDMKALQQGVTYKDLHGRQFHRQAFNQDYFPVSRLISTFPSISDPSWTEILGNRPPPGYQRTYFDATEDSEIFLNGVTSSDEYEKQMTWQMEGGFHRTMGYVFPQWSFKYEVDALIDSFLHTDGAENYYALVHSTDSAQHLSGDIFSMLSTLDEKLQQLRDIYRIREGRELEILLLSDHGNNHAGAGKRIAVRSFLKKAGYRITQSLKNPNDIVLPTAGIESWIEIHNFPAKTETLVPLLTHLEGVDIVTGRFPDQTNRFLVMNSKAERATVDWNPAQNSFRYSPENGDPIGYRPVVEALAKKNELDSDGFAPADAWLAETFTHHYPDAPERIVQGHTRVAQNPATIIVSLKNEYVHSGWFIKKGAALTISGGTHGALDDINSDGILVSSFAPTKDTSTSRVAALFDGFKGRRDARGENGAEWTFSTAGAQPLSAEEVFLRIWTPAFTNAAPDAPVDIAIEEAGHTQPPHKGRPDPKSWRLTITHPLPATDNDPHERIYAFPADLTLPPQTAYRISGQISSQNKIVPIFNFHFHTDTRGQPTVTDTGT